MDRDDLILSELEVRAEPFALCALKGACSMGLGRNAAATLHYVLEGAGALSVQGRAPLALAPGRLVLVPASMRHSLRNDGGTPAQDGMIEPGGLDLEQHLAVGPGESRLMVLCSTVSLGLRETHGLIDLLRSPLCLDTAAAPIAAGAVDSLLLEMGRPRIGRRAMIRALLLQCVIELFRARLEAGEPALVWLTGLADVGLWQALREMLDDPGAAHSLETLAEAAGMSRTRFAERFQVAYGHTPMAFLRELRLARAAQLLGAGGLPVKRVARMVGFSSRSAFTRAFTEAHGLSPRHFRAGAG